MRMPLAAAMTTLLPSRSLAPDADAALVAALGSIEGRSDGALSPAARFDAEGGVAAVAAAGGADVAADGGGLALAPSTVEVGLGITTGGATGTAVAAAAGSAAESTGIVEVACCEPPMTVLVLLLMSPSLMTGQAAPEADAAVSARVCAGDGAPPVAVSWQRAPS